MKEVVKRQDPAPEELMPKKKQPFYVLCIVKVGINMVPVYLPEYNYGVKIGDLLTFFYEDDFIQAEVKFTDYCKMDAATWTAVTVATQQAPIRAIKHTQQIHNDVKWEEEEE